MSQTADGAPAARTIQGALLAPIDTIRTSRQPRRWFDPEKLAALAASIRERGILQPLLVRTDPRGGYLLLAGERRLRASREVGLREVPILIREVDDADAFLEALIENVVRADLTLEEEARAYQRLLDLGMSQREVARRTGINQSTISRALRLWADETLGDAVTTGALGQAEAQELLALTPEERAPIVEIVTERRRGGEVLSRLELRALVERQRRTGRIPASAPPGPPPLIRPGLAGAPIHPPSAREPAAAPERAPEQGPHTQEARSAPTPTAPTAAPIAHASDVDGRALRMARSRARALRLHIEVEMAALRSALGDPLVQEEITEAQRALASKSAEN